jgi:hypothetical protein
VTSAPGPSQIGPTTITEVIAQMERIDGTLPRKDGVAYFNRLYLQVTKAVEAATAGVTFAAPEFTERLDVVFAALYFAAEATIGTGAMCPIAWRPLVEERAEDRAPIQFAILGDVEGQVAGWFETGLIADIADVIPKDVDNALAMWSIADARDLAWSHAKLLWGMRNDPLLADAYGDFLARLVELSGRGILI